MPLVDINYGFREGVQLKTEVPWRVVHEPGTGNQSGVGSLGMGVKWRFYNDTSAGLAISTYPALVVGDANAFLKEVDATEFFLPVQVRRSWGAFALNAEGGYRWLKGSTSEIVFGLAAGLRSIEKLELLSECRGTTGSDFTGLVLLSQLGARRPLAPHVNFLGAVGAAPIAPAGERTTFRLYLGVQSHW